MNKNRKKKILGSSLFLAISILVLPPFITIVPDKPSVVVAPLVGLLVSLFVPTLWRVRFPFLGLVLQVTAGFIILWALIRFVVVLVAGWLLILK